MAANEHITAKVGADTSLFNQAMRGATNTAKRFGADVVASFSGIGAKLGAAFSIGALVSFSNKLLEFSNELQRNSEALGVSTDFLQGFQYGAEQSGSSAKKAAKGIELLSKAIGDARSGGEQSIEKFALWGIALEDANGIALSTEQIIRLVADRMQQTSDGTLRAKMAFDLFGKSGIELIPVLKGGAAGLDEFLSSAPILSADAIKSIDDFGDAVARLKNQLLVMGGVGVKAVSQMVEAFHSIGKDLSNDYPPTQAELVAESLRLEAIQKKIADMQKRADEPETEFWKEQDAHMARLAKGEKADEKRIKAEEKITAEKKKQSVEMDKQQLAARNALDSVMESLNHSKEDGLLVTLSELAGMNTGRFNTADRNKSIIDARRIAFMEQDARDLFDRGHVWTADIVKTKADSLKEGLRGTLKSGEFKFDAALKAVQSAEFQLKELVRKSEEEGLNINPKNSR